MKKSELEPASVGSQLGLMLAFCVVGYFAGGIFGAVVGAGFAYVSWWLREIHFALHQKNHEKRDE